MNESLRNYISEQIIRLKDDLQHYKLVEKDSFLERHTRYELGHFISIEKEINAFDVIITKGVNVGEFKCLVNNDTTYEQYVYFHEHFKELEGGLLTMGNVPLSKQDFNLVKESILCHW